MINNEIKLEGYSYKYELRNTPNGKKVCRFGLKFYNGKDKDGNSKYAFVSCKGFDDYALSDKEKVIVNGSLSQSEWTDKQGNQKKELQILVSSIDRSDFPLR